jgi:hypothetical protein
MALVSHYIPSSAFPILRELQITQHGFMIGQFGLSIKKGNPYKGIYKQKKVYTRLLKEKRREKVPLHFCHSFPLFDLGISKKKKKTITIKLVCDINANPVDP